MRAIYLFVFLVACGAKGADTPFPDAGLTDATSRPDDGFPCVRGREAFIGGVCVPFSAEHCGAVGRACPAGQVCELGSDGDGGSRINCTTP